MKQKTTNMIRMANPITHLAMEVENDARLFKLRVRDAKQEHLNPRTDLVFHHLIGFIKN